MPIPFLAPDDDTTPFPAVETALEEPNGLLMAGASLSPERLITAYKLGIFPWYEEGEPVLWWSPNPRCVIFPQQIKIRRSLRKSINNRGYELTENTAYRDVMKQCGAPRKGSNGTWVTQAMIDAYCRLNSMGIARSIEVWHGDALVGGLYGIQVGRVFVGESMFSRQPDASKAALVHLAHCGRYCLIDCQLETDHLRSMGATTISRTDYLELLHRYGNSESSPVAQTQESAL